jgi:biotin-(acetyl-CoA carboxylase) ligase
VLGIGLNVAVRPALDLPGELRLAAASLELEPEAIERVLADVLGALAVRLAEPAAATLAAWRGRDALHGREIAWAGGSGRAAGVDGDGRLVVVRADGGRTSLDAGEVHLRAQ